MPHYAACGDVQLTDSGYLADGDGWQLRIRLSVPEIEARLRVVGQRAKEAREASDPLTFGALGGADVAYMTSAELAARHYLLSMLPLTWELAEAARQRIRERHAARRAGVRPRA